MVLVTMSLTWSSVVLRGFSVGSSVGLFWEVGFLCYYAGYAEGFE
jgi:hypothetical protein